MTAPPADASDESLAAAVCHPEHGSAAFRRLYDRHAADLLALVSARFPRVADEVCQEAWLRAFDALRKGPRPMPNFRGWVWTIARNLATQRFRGRPTSDLGAVGEVASGTPSPPAQLEKREREEVMAPCYDRLKRQKPEFAAVIAAFLDGEPPETAAKRLDISRNNFDQRKKRALDALQQCVESRLT